MSGPTESPREDLDGASSGSRRRRFAGLLRDSGALAAYEHRHRDRVLRVSLGLAVAFSLTGALVEVLRDDLVGFRISVGSAVLWLGCLFALRGPARIVTVGNIAAAVALAHLAAKWVLTWNDEQNLAIIAIVPTVAAAILGAGWGLVWTAITLASVALLVFATEPTLEWGLHLWWSTTAFVSILAGGVVTAEFLRARSRAETEQIRRSLDAERARFGEIVDSSFQVIIETDADNRVRYASPQLGRAIGVSSEELMGTNAFRLVHPDDRDTVTRSFVSGSAERRRAELRVTDGQGGWRWHEVATGSYETPGGELRRIFAGRDITLERSERERRFDAQKVESLGVLAGALAHDFNNLLTIIQGHAELLDPCESRDAIRDAADRAGKLTERLLAVGRRQMLSPETVPLDRIVRDAAPMIRSLVREDIDLHYDLPQGLDPVEVDSGQIEQVLLNLVSNACDAMPGGGALRISTAWRELDEAEAAGLGVGVRKAVALEVADTGLGMDDATLRQALDPFFTTKSMGTGLGLPSVSGIVEQSHATLRISSTPGAGTRVAVLFPPSSGPVATRREHPARRIDAPVKPARVLVVEDDPRVRSIIVRTLRECGYDTAAAESGQQALAMTGSSPDLLVTDVIMPGMRGPELADRMRQANRALRVLFVSGYDDEAELASNPDPAVGFLRKPFTPSALSNAVEELRGRVIDGPSPGIPEA